MFYFQAFFIFLAVSSRGFQKSEGELNETINESIFMGKVFSTVRLWKFYYYHFSYFTFRLCKIFFLFCYYLTMAPLGWSRNQRSLKLYELLVLILVPRVHFPLNVDPGNEIVSTCVVSDVSQISLLSSFYFWYPTFLLGNSLLIISLTTLVLRPRRRKIWYQETKNLQDGQFIW